MTDKTKTYAEAIAVIEDILNQIEKGELDVDDLATKVKQAAGLLNFCREKLFATEKELDKILQEMDQIDDEK